MATVTMKAMNIHRSHATGSRRSSLLPRTAPTIAPAAMKAPAITSTSPWSR